MTRDYKTQSRPRARRGRGSSGFFWFVTGAVVGAFGVGLAWMLQGSIQQATVAQSTSSEAKPTTKPRFDFYNILPEMEVLVPDDELAERTPPPPKPAAEQKKPEPPPKPAEQQTAQTPATPAGGTSYLLQVASLRSAPDAERLKAQLALLGIQTRIQRVTINNKDTYHRVRAGPYGSKPELNKARALLSSNGLESMAIKLK